MTKKSKVVTKYYKEADLDNIIGQVIKDAGSLQQKMLIILCGKSG